MVVASSGAAPALVRALVVEDERAVRSLLRELLEGWGLEVDEAASHDEARRQLFRRPPDLVLSDLGLPDGSGLDLLDALWRSRPRLPVVLMGAAPEPAAIRRSLQLGAAGLLFKPFSPTAIRVALLSALASRLDSSAS